MGQRCMYLRGGSAEPNKAAASARDGRNGANSNKRNAGLKKPLIVPKVSCPMSLGGGREEG